MLKDVAPRLSALRCQYLLPLIVVPGALLSSTAHAQSALEEAEVLRPYVGVSLSHEDNILGTSDVAIAAGAAKLSDTARRIEAGLIFNKTVSQQRLSASLNLDHTSYNRFNNLDYNGRDLRANWNWHVGNHLEGNVGAAQVRALTAIQDSGVASGLPSQLPNVRTQNHQYFDARWHLHPSWRLRSGIGHYSLDYAETGSQIGNRTVNDGELGLDYLASSGSSIGLIYRHAEGDFDNSPTNNYSQNEIKGRLEYKFSGKTEFIFLAGWVRRENAQTAANDYSGFNGRMNAIWRATGKTTIRAGIWREIAALDDLTAAYSLNRGLSLEAEWEITRQLKLDGYVQYERRDYTPSNLARKDSVNYSSLQISYYPARKWRLQAAIHRTVQHSDVVGSAYSNLGVSVGARYEF